MNAIRSTLVFTWLVLSLVPCGIALLVASLFLKDEKVWWWFAVPWLKGVVEADQLPGRRMVAGEQAALKAMVLMQAGRDDEAAEFFRQALRMPLATRDAVATLGAMQVSAAFAIAEVEKRTGRHLGLGPMWKLRDELYTRKGGVAYGTRMLLGYRANRRG